MPELIRIANLKGDPGEPALGVDPQQDLLADWVNDPAGNPFKTALDAEIGANVSRELAYAVNNSGQGTDCAIGGSNTGWIAGCIITVPPTERPVYLEWGGVLTVANPGWGNLQLAVYNLDQINAYIAPLVGDTWLNCTPQSPAFQYSGHIEGSKRIGPSAVPRTYGLAALVYQIDGTLTGYTSNSDAPYETFLGAYAR